jgi:hypothetical protein
MVRSIWVLGGLLMPFAAETYHAACLAFDATTKTIYFSDPFETECASQVTTCTKGVTDQWAAHLKKEGLAQSPGVTLRCEMYREGSTPDESPRSRVRKWRDEEMAQGTAGQKKYAKVTATNFEGG